MQNNNNLLYFCFTIIGLWTGHGASSCVEQTTCTVPDPICTPEKVSAAQQTTCETACKDKSSCQMYMFKDNMFVTSCDLYTCQRCRTSGKKDIASQIYFCSPAPTIPTADCGDPVVPNHGTVTLTNGVTTVGATAHQACNNGYDISGIADISCGASGSWNAAPVTCSLKDCGDPPTPAHGKVTLTNHGETSYGSTATQACNPGFDLSGTAYISCKADKSWCAKPVTCSIVECGSPTSPGNGTVKLTDAGTTTYGATATQSCNTGFDLTGVTNITCGANGSWSEAAITCTFSSFKDCGSPTSPVNGSVLLADAGITTYGAVATQLCDIGYNLQGEVNITCMADGNWSDSVAICKIKDCKVPEKPSNGIVKLAADGVTTYGATARVLCNAVYEIVGDVSLRCSADGAWSSLSSCAFKGYIAALAAIGGVLVVGLAAVACCWLIIRKFMKPLMSISPVNNDSCKDENFTSTTNRTDSVMEDSGYCSKQQMEV